MLRVFQLASCALGRGSRAHLLLLPGSGTALCSMDQTRQLHGACAQAPRCFKPVTYAAPSDNNNAHPDHQTMVLHPIPTLPCHPSATLQPACHAAAPPLQHSARRAAAATRVRRALRMPAHSQPAPAAAAHFKQPRTLAARGAGHARAPLLAQPACAHADKRPAGGGRRRQRRACTAPTTLHTIHSRARVSLQTSSGLQTSCRAARLPLQSQPAACPLLGGDTEEPQTPAGLAPPPLQPAAKLNSHTRAPLSTG